MAKIIGIDLGTTYCCVAVCDADGPRVLFNRQGTATMPAMVAITRTGRRLVGALAKRQAITNPLATIYGAKRLIGRRYLAPEVGRALPLLSYRCVPGLHGDVRAVVAEREFAMPEVASILLYELRQTAERALGEPVTQAVITVPAYFNDNQRQATRDAGRIAGLEVLRIVNEPTAAALAYGFGRHLRQKLAVYDLGGGTFDISIVDIGDDVFDVLASAGNTFLGGEDFDERIMQWLLRSFQQRYGIDLRQDPMALQRLRDAAERAKVDLSAAAQVEIALPYIHAEGAQSPLHLNEVLSRSQFETMVADLVARTIETCGAALAQADLSVQDVDAVLLVGGMTRMPMVRHAVEAYFGRAATKGAHPDEAVACGAALTAGLVASGARDVLLVDITPHDLGVVVAGGRFEVVVPRGSRIPTQTKKIFTTSRADQVQVRILVAQGHAGRAHERDMLGEFLLDGLQPQAVGAVQIEVSFQISVDGIVGVSARDLATGRAQRIRVLANSGLTDAEVTALAAENDQLQLVTRALDAAEATQLALERSLRDAERLLRQAPQQPPQAASVETLIQEARRALEAATPAAQEICRAALEAALAPLRPPANRR